MNIWHNAKKERITPESFQACIEISKGSKNKYEFDKETGYLRLDRILYTSTHYPHNYGFIPRTLADDGDPLDVLVICSETIVPLALVECRPIGVLEMTDNGQGDEKIIAVCPHDPMYANYFNIDELPQHVIDEISHFFRVYKELENKETIINEDHGPKKAKAIIQKCIDQYLAKYGEDYLHKGYNK